MSAYIELQVTSNYSFLRGASHPYELIGRASSLGYNTIALTDRNTFSGVVKAHIAAREKNIRLIPGVRLDLSNNLEFPNEHSGPSFLSFPTDQFAYSRLSKLLTIGKQRAPKGKCWITLRDLLDHARGQILIALPPEPHEEKNFSEMLKTFSSSVRAAYASCYLAVQYLYRGDDESRFIRLESIAQICGTPLVATNDVHAHDVSRRALQDVLTCIRESCTIDNAGWRLQTNAERYLKSSSEMSRLFAKHLHAVIRTREIAQACKFNLDQITHQYPSELIEGECSAQIKLEKLSWQGAALRWQKGIPSKVKSQITYELELIDKLNYASYFLTVFDIISFARDRGILCQGRGSAANSVVCYCLNITAVDPGRIDLLFERFVSAARDEPPDIDVDFEHERREEVIQYIYDKYGREHAAITGSVVSFRSRSAVREIGKVFGLSSDIVQALVNLEWRQGVSDNVDNEIKEIGLDLTDRRLALVLNLTRQLIGFPRHLSQHVGGFVITKGLLSEMVPIMNAAMKNRTNIEWDKNDLDALGILKIDILGLGILSCIKRGVELLEQEYGKKLTLQEIPAEDPVVYDMLCKADTIGVFQIESRAQMSMLPRLKPRNFYDLVIEIAIVRPGPIQGDMVHPYLKRRNGLDPIIFPSAELEKVLGKTLGIPLFQEQAMKVAIVAAGFTPEDADRLRRAMATFKHTGLVHKLRNKMVKGMTERGYDKVFANHCFSQIEGFSDYGFPESHAASFALLVYTSAWLKCHYPSIFAAAILNSQPMGFYGPAQIISDARKHGVEVRGVDVNASTWDCSLEIAEGSRGLRALRLGFRQIKGFPELDAAGIVAARGETSYSTILDLWRRTGIKKALLERLARADAFCSMGLCRQRAAWNIRGLNDVSLPLFAANNKGLRNQNITDHSKRDYDVLLPHMNLAEEVMEDYEMLKLSLRCHPLQLLRPGLLKRNIKSSKELLGEASGSIVGVGGLVLVRQRPATAKGVVFITLEDDTGNINLIVWGNIFKRFRHVAMGARLIICRGKLQREGLVSHIVANQLEDYSKYLDGLKNLYREKRKVELSPFNISSRDFH